MIGIGLDITRAGQTVSFSPENLRVGTRDVRDLTLRPNRMYSNLLGTTPIAGPGAEVAAIRDSRGVLVATQATAAARPKYAVEPAVGVRNRATGSAAVADDARWFDTSTSDGVTATKLSSGVTPDGNAWARYQVAGTATGTAFPQLYNGVQSRTPASSGQSWTTSALARVESGTTGSAASGLRVNADEETAPATSVGSAVSPVFSGASLTTISATRAITTGNQARASLLYRLGDGETADCIVYVEALQFELGTTRTAWQANRSQFDITEANVRSVNALVTDGVDDFMSLATGFEPAGAFTVAASFVPTGVFPVRLFSNDSGFAQIGFGSATLGEVRANNTANRSEFSPLANLLPNPTVNIVRVQDAASATFWRNGVATTGTVTGDAAPLAAGGLTRMFQITTGVGGALRFFGGVMIDEGNTPFTEAERLMTQRYLAYNGGITL